MNEIKNDPVRRPQPLISQETVDILAAADTMEEFLSLAAARGVDWNMMPDEWLSAIAQGDVTELCRQMRHKPKKGKQNRDVK